MQGKLQRNVEERRRHGTNVYRNCWHTRKSMVTRLKKAGGSLGIWVKQQRTEYRRMKKGQKCFMTAEKALQLKEIGFQFDAEKYKGRNRDLSDVLDKK
jgi:hypothetical protein